MTPEKITPIRKQYLDIKKQYPDTIVFFRLGDFYETFDHDAEIASNVLDIVLTSRNVAKGQRIPMAGIPFHAADNYISRLIEKGYPVAICEQIGDLPQQGLFPREVIRVVTPGTIIEPGLLKNEANNYLVSIVSYLDSFGIAFADISTGEFCTAQFSGENALQNLNSEISRLSPAEILMPESLNYFASSNYFISRLPDWKFEISRAETNLLNHLKTSTLEGFGIKDMPGAIIASGALIEYIDQTSPETKTILSNLKLINTSESMILDEATRRNLELTEPIRRNNENHALIHIIDDTKTPMGKRLIRQWINKPLIKKSEIDTRLEAVSIFYEQGLLRAEVQKIFKSLADIERITNRVMVFQATPRDLIALRNTLDKLPELVRLLGSFREQLGGWISDLQDCSEACEILHKAISDDPPATLQNIGVIKAGFSEELDEIIHASSDARDWIANLEKKEKQRTGIKNLRVGYNKVFGYYIELSKSNTGLAPENYIRKQTLVNGERFITPELKEYEILVLNAEENIRSLENQLFKKICSNLAKSSRDLLNVSRAIAGLDVLISYAQIANQNNYCRPILREDCFLVIKDGRHPVVEKTRGQSVFVPNDVAFSDQEVIKVITGPNMSGKSTYLRQVALIVLLAQIGSFVPASYAEIGIVDRIFTRIGAQDEIQAGQSTFMVEMIETANILRNATNRSLLILDEIGRGTSTYDGLSIAWAVLEFIHNNPGLKARTLFATHFHELTRLSESLPGINNYNVAVSEVDKDVIFLHKIIPGGADRSYGIHVAQMAGIPSVIIQRSYELLQKMEKQSPSLENRKRPIQPQLLVDQNKNQVLDELAGLDINSLSPLEALNLLFRWQNKVNNKN